MDSTKLIRPGDSFVPTPRPMTSIPVGRHRRSNRRKQVWSSRRHLMMSSKADRGPSLPYISRPTCRSPHSISMSYGLNAPD